MNLAKLVSPQVRQQAEEQVSYLPGLNLMVIPLTLSQSVTSIQ